MPLTPNDVVNKQFAKVFRGYDMEEVDAFLDEVEEELKRLLTEKAQLESRSAQPAARAPEAAPVAAATPPPVSAPDPEDSQQAALRTLLMAQRTADQAIEEARAEADKVLAEARYRASQVDNEINARTTAALASLEGQRREIEARIDDLRAFEREYRLRLKAYLESQLKDLDTRGGGPDAGAGVPAAARAAAVGPLPPGIAQSGPAEPPITLARQAAPAVQAAIPPVAPPPEVKPAELPPAPPSPGLPAPEGFPEIASSGDAGAPPSHPAGPPREAADTVGGVGPFAPADRAPSEEPEDRN
jgi:DivIVA domain-containing protein